jgi:integrase
MRRSELVALNVDDIRKVAEGIVLRINRSKTDQDGAGQLVAVPYATHHPELDPVLALRRWLDRAHIDSGAIFVGIDKWGVKRGRLEPKSVATIIKRRAKAVGLDPDRFAGHSLRAGFATAAAQAGASDRAIMATTRHRSLATMHRYVRPATIWQDVAARTML